MSGYITKSRLTAGLRCARMVWLQSHRPGLAKSSAMSEMSRSAGLELGKLARRYNPQGLLIGHVEQPALAVAETSGLIASGVNAPLFESAVERDGVLVRVDILRPQEDGWCLVQVKSSSSVKDSHLADCAVQLWVLEGNGIKIDRVHLSHVNTAFEYAGDSDYEGLLVEEDVTDRVRGLAAEVPEWLVSHQDILMGAEPQVRMSGRCDTCAFVDHCERDLPEFPVAILPHGRKIVQQLLDEGITDLRGIPPDRLQNERHIMVWHATRTNEVFISKKLRQELCRLAYPRYYLDFESISFLIPRWEGSRPNQHIPFQWSCHVEHEDGLLEHREFLATDEEAPMRSFAESLIEDVDRGGPIIVYGAFEQTILQQLIEVCPSLKRPLREIIDRLVDLLPLLREHYYHPVMKGSWSIKAVLPTVAPHLDYSTLEGVQNGTMAQQAYMTIVDPLTPPDQREQTIRSLLAYCQRDTLAMVEVVKFLEGMEIA